MRIVEAEELSIDGVWSFTPVHRADDRGFFLESFKDSVFAQATGRDFDLKQVNTSVSRLGTIRGIHFADVPPGQAKYIQCLSGRILDVVVDIRVGSPSFGQWVAVELDAKTCTGLFISEGLGHAFCALTSSATVSYLCNQAYAPAREHGIDPLDQDLGIPWPEGVDPVLSAKDAQAPTLSKALSCGRLPSFETCQKLVLGR